MTVNDLERPAVGEVKHAMTRDSLGEAGRLVWDFLQLFAERRYVEANGFLAPGAVMEFPGGVRFTDCTELPKRSAANYRWVAKVFERIEEFEAPEGTVVYNYGALFGQWVDGVAFDGIRYVDRFLIRDGKIVDQKVWNDLAIAMARR
jgi:hypothetical protein